MLKCAILALSLTLATPPKVTFKQESHDRAGWYEVSATIPTFSGNEIAKLASRECAKIARDRMAEFRDEYDRNDKPDRIGYFDWSPVVSLLTDSMVSLYAHSDTYTGGAHGNRDFVGLNFAMVAGKPKRIVLADLMDPGADPVVTASELVIPKLRAMNASSVIDGGVTQVTPQQADNFVVTPAGITWLFSPYEVASYAEGH
ncbi:MAG: DUF3298 domain-containing protein, partial [Fimbriimonadaceae bacterium]